MLVQVKDFNRSDKLLSNKYATQWEDLVQVLEEMPLHLKPSGQNGLQGNAIFDPVGTNEYIKSALSQRPGWHSNVTIPAKYKCLGTGVDFINGGVLVEVQFSNYPFLLNNLVRSELLFQAKIPLKIQPVEVVIIITKAHMLPASNSTLYYEQAQDQLSILAEGNVYDVPIKLVGLFGSIGDIKATWTEYEGSGSRTVVNQDTKTFCIKQSPKKKIATITVT